MVRIAHGAACCGMMRSWSVLRCPCPCRPRFVTRSLHPLPIAEKLDELGRMREAFQNLERRHAELRVAYDAEICRLRELVVLAGEKPGTSLVEPVPVR